MRPAAGSGANFAGMCTYRRILFSLFSFIVLFPTFPKINQMRKTFTPVASGLVLGALLLQSCATIISGTSQTVRLVGQPAGSSVFVNDKAVTATPVAGEPDAVKIRVPRRRSAEIKVKHEGYKEYTEVLYSVYNPVSAINNVGYVITLGSLFGSISAHPKGPDVVPLVGGAALAVGGSLLDLATGAAKKFNKKEIHPVMARRPASVAGGQSVQCSLVNVHFKGGDKMGSLYIGPEIQETLYFGKTLDVNADNLQANVNDELKDLGYRVPAQGRSVFAAGPSARYALQGEMRDIKYDIRASSPFAPAAHYETTCNVEVTWKLLDQNRQTVVEQKTAGHSIKFENGGNAAFTDAFENSLYAFLDKPEVSAVLAATGPAPAPAAAAGTAPAAKAGVATAADKPAAISIHQPAPLQLTGDNGVGAAAKCVATVSTADGHGSGCLVSADGYLVTNAHVVGDEETVQVQLADGLEVKGKVVRVNKDMDLALVKIDTEGLTAFSLPTTSTAEIGSDVFAIGTPADKELGQSITKGIISGRRKIDGHALLQTDVSINGGNSGGALVTRSGQLLGIVNAKLVGRGIEGIGFAIPAEQVADALQLKFIN